MKTPRILLALLAGSMLALPACSRPSPQEASPTAAAPAGAEQSTQEAASTPAGHEGSQAAGAPASPASTPPAPAGQPAGEQTQPGQAQPGQPQDGQPHVAQPQGALTLAALPASGDAPTAFYGPGGVVAALIASPSGNICCDIFDGDAVSCMINSWAQDMPYGRDDLGRPIIAVFLESGGQLEHGGRGDPPACSGAYGVAPQLLDYGKTVAYGGFMCHSMEIGMACWKPDLGRGFLVNRDGWQELN